jgi:hypothetical protein
MPMAGRVRLLQNGSLRKTDEWKMWMERVKRAKFVPEGCNWSAARSSTEGEVMNSVIIRKE